MATNGAESTSQRFAARVRQFTQSLGLKVAEGGNVTGASKNIRLLFMDLT